jgi:hypothetical protein
LPLRGGTRTTRAIPFSRLREADGSLALPGYRGSMAHLMVPVGSVPWRDYRHSPSTQPASRSAAPRTPSCHRGLREDYSPALTRTVVGEDWGPARIGRGDRPSDRWSVRQKPPHVRPRNSHRISGGLRQPLIRQKQLFVCEHPQGSRLACSLPSEKRLSCRPRWFENSGKGFSNTNAKPREPH